MVIDQRNAGASVTPTDTQYLLDRWLARLSQASKYTVQQNAGSITPPSGFRNYLGVTVGASASVTIGVSDYFGIQQYIEGFNIADLSWGTASAKSITLSFQVYCSLTGTFAGSLRNSDTTRSYPFTYTISSANTWTQISITIPGDTSGTWLFNNGIGINLQLSFGAGGNYNGTANSWQGGNYITTSGVTNLISTNSATMYITGVQLEAGSAASPFEYRQYGTELALCQRYYEKFDAGGTSGSYATWAFGYANTGGVSAPFTFKFAVNKRANPTISQGGTLRVLSASATGSSPSCTDNYLGTTGGYSNTTWTNSITAGQAIILGANNDANAYVAFSAEL
jgi:hypothetical protein